MIVERLAPWRSPLKVAMDFSFFKLSIRLVYAAISLLPSHGMHTTITPSFSSANSPIDLTTLRRGAPGR